MRLKFGIESHLIPIYRTMVQKDAELNISSLLPAANESLSSSAEIAKLFSEMLLSDIFRDVIIQKGQNDRENVVAAFLDGTCTLRGLQIVAIGSRDNVTIGVQEIARTACVLGTEFLVLCHNHPNARVIKEGRKQVRVGYEPSPMDIKFTTELYAALQILRVDLMDHIILGEVDPLKPVHFLSMWQSGYFKREIFPALTERTLSDYCPNIKKAIRMKKKTQHNVSSP